jgi:hypothetical protein
MLWVWSRTNVHASFTRTAPYTQDLFTMVEDVKVPFGVKERVKSFDIRNQAATR